MISRRWARSSALQVPCRRCCTNQTTEPFIVAISRRKRLFSRLLPAKKEQNHSGARSMRRWNAKVESGSNGSVVAAAVSEGCDAVMANTIFSADAGSANGICADTAQKRLPKSTPEPHCFQKHKLLALNPSIGASQACRSLTLGFDSVIKKEFSSSKLPNQSRGRQKRQASEPKRLRDERGRACCYAKVVARSSGSFAPAVGVVATFSRLLACGTAHASVAQRIGTAFVARLCPLGVAVSV